MRLAVVLLAYSLAACAAPRERPRAQELQEVVSCGGPLEVGRQVSWVGPGYAPHPVPEGEEGLLRLMGIPVYVCRDHGPDRHNFWFERE